MKNRSFLGGAVLMVLSGLSVGQGAVNLTTLVSFDRTDGEEPAGSLTIDPTGNILGATYFGGTYVNSPVGFDQGGTVFELSGADHQTFSTLVNFNNSGGQGAYGSLVADAAGNLYGVTRMGGTNNAGTVYELSGSNHQTVATAFSFPIASGYPRDSLVIDSAGNLYGISTTASGTSAVFELTGPNHQTLVTLATFYSVSLFGGLTMDKAGNLFGTTANGGSGAGSVYELTGSNHQTLKTLWSFSDIAGSKGAQDPKAGLTFDSQGNLYGTTAGNSSGVGASVFELSGTNFQKFTTLVNFNGSSGQTPLAPLLFDSNGSIFGTLLGPQAGGGGSVFELSGSNDQTLTTLANFDSSTGNGVEAGLTADSEGNLYGVTAIGGVYNYGTVFELSGTDFAVPEPATLSLLTLAPLTLLRRRRNSKPHHLPTGPFSPV